MAVFKCKMCGGQLEVSGNETVITCEYCGTQQTLPKVDDEVITNLYNRANTLRLKSEFDKAEEIYGKIIEADKTQAEAYWGVILCKYGIEYVEDPTTYKRVPTCHRASFEAVTADEDYKLALQYADAAQKSVYEAEAKVIDEIQKGILAISRNEKPYDVFICYKQTDESGKRTNDSVIANDIYYQLTQEGFKVFYAAITLEDKLGQEYEPYIFAALNSAKVMLVIGSRSEYFNAVWVKNEWSRFLKLMKADRSKLLIPCYKDMDAYELPEEFAHLQAQDMGKIGFINDVVRGIKKVVVKDEKQPEKEISAVNNTPAQGAAGNIAPLLERAFMFLEDGNWEEADSYCEKVLDQDPKNAKAYLGKLMAHLKVKKQTELKDCQKPFDGWKDFEKAVRFGDESLKAELNGYIKFINERNENERKTGIYNNAVNAMKKANSENEYKSAAGQFKSVSGFKDADTLAEQCLDKAEICRKDDIYEEATDYMSDEAEISDYEEAIDLFKSIPGWKDADKQINICQKKIEEIKAKEEAERLEAERKAEAERIAAEKAAKKRKKTAIIAIVCIVLIGALASVLIPAMKKQNTYKDAVAKFQSKDYVSAIVLLQELGNYKESQDMLKEGQEKIYQEAIDLFERNQFDASIEKLELLGDYKDSADLLISVQKEKLYQEILSALSKDQSIDYGEIRTKINELGNYKNCSLIVDEINSCEKMMALLDPKEYNDLTLSDCVSLLNFNSSTKYVKISDKVLKPIEFLAPFLGSWHYARGDNKVLSYTAVDSSKYRRIDTVVSTLGVYGISVDDAHPSFKVPGERYGIFATVPTINYSDKTITIGACINGKFVISMKNKDTLHIDFDKNESSWSSYVEYTRDSKWDELIP